MTKAMGVDAGRARAPSRESGRLRRLGAVAAGAVGAVVPAAVAAQERVHEWHWGMHPMWGIWGAGMMLMMFAFWAVVIASIVLGIRWVVSQGRPANRDAALEILRQRYARGEIDKQEFEAKKRDLS